MKAKENVKNNDINLRADTLADLPVADGQAEEISGGRGGTSGNDILIGDLATEGGR